MVGRKEKPVRVKFHYHTLQIVPFPLKPGSGIKIRVEELEAMRLVDLLGKKQEEAAREMGCSRSKVARLLKCARSKLIRAIVEGKMMFVVH